MSVLNLPSTVLRSTVPAVARSVRPATLRTVPAGSERIVGRSAAGPSTITRESLAQAIKTVKPRSPLSKKTVIIGGTSIGVGALAGMGVDELVDTLNVASPQELQSLVGVADESGETSVADAVAEVYNAMTFVETATLQPSQGDRGLTIVDNIERAGLGLDINAIDKQQALARAYKSIRGLLSYDDIWTLRVLITTANEEDLMALEDMYRG